MPLYEYDCRECGCRFDKIIRVLSEESDIRCPQCSSAKVEKAISLCGRVSAGSSVGMQESSCAPASG